MAFGKIASKLAGKVAKKKKKPVKKMKPRTKAAAGVLGGATGASALTEKKRFGGAVLKLADVAKRLKTRPKSKTTTKKRIAKKKPKDAPLQKHFISNLAKKRHGGRRKAAKMVQGAGDKSDPKVGKFGAGQKQARGGATPSAKEAMSSTEKDKLARQKAAAGSFKRAQGLKKGSIKQLEDAYDKLTAGAKRAQGLKKGSIKQLEDAYDKLTAGAKRAQRLKGTKSKYYPVFKKRNMKPMKKGGPIGSTTKPKERPVDGIKTAAAQPSWMKGLSQKEIDSILGKPSRDSEGVKRSDKKKKKKKKVITAKEGRKVLRPVDQTKNPGLAKLPTKVRNNMGFAKKGGKVSYRKGGGQALVASLYD